MLQVGIRRFGVELLWQSIQFVLFDVVDHRVGQQILYTLTPSNEQTNFAGGDVVEDGLLDDLQVLAVAPKQIVGQQEGPYVCARPFDDHAAVSSEDVMQIYVRPNARFAHTLD